MGSVRKKVGNHWLKSCFSLKWLLFQLQTTTNIIQWLSVLWVLGHQFSPKKSQSLCAASAQERWKHEAVSALSLWQDRPTSRCMFTTRPKWRHQRFDASISQRYLLRHIPCLLSIRFLTGNWICITSLKGLMVCVAFTYIRGKLMPL